MSKDQIVTLEDDLKHTRNLFGQTENWLDNGRTSELIELVQQEIEREPGYTGPHVLLALAHLQRDEVEEARSAIERLPKPYREWTTIYSTLGAIAFKEENFSEAVTHYDHALSIEESAKWQAEFCYWKGLAYAQMGKWADSVESLQQAYQQDSKFLYIFTRYFGVWGNKFRFFFLSLFAISLMLVIWMTSWWILIPLTIVVIIELLLIVSNLVLKDYNAIQRKAYQIAFYIIMATVIRQITGLSVPW